MREQGPWVELCRTKFANCAVTDKVPEAEDVSYHRLVVSFTEHEGDKLADRCKQHQHVTGSLCFITEALIAFTLSQRGGYPSCHFVLIRDILIIIFTTSSVDGHFMFALLLPATL